MKYSISYLNMKDQFLKLIISTALILFFSLSGFAQFQINTVPPLNGGSGSAGITFNVTAHNDLTIDTLFASFSSTGNTEIWYSQNPISGSPTISTANGWVRLATANVSKNARGDGSISPIEHDLGLKMLKGQTFGFYIDGTKGAPLRYTVLSPARPAPFSDSNITIETGTNVGYGGAAPTPSIHPRQFNGGIKYTIIGGMDDAAVVSIDLPNTYCTGLRNVEATIGNFGINQIDSVDVHWEINGIAQTSFKYTQLLDTLNGSNPNTAKITLGQHNFQGPTEIKVFTSMPNNMVDTSNYNDTVVLKTSPQFAGSYSVNSNQPASPTNFTSLSSMISALSKHGLCGPTTVNVANGTYNEVLHITNIPGLSVNSNLVIDGGDSSQTIVSQDGSIAFATLIFDGVRHVRVQNMTLEMSGTKGAAVIFKNASYDTLNNCVTRIDPSLKTSAVYNISFSNSITLNGSNAIVSNVVIQNNNIIGGFRGVSSSGPTTNPNQNNKIYNNIVDSVYSFGFNFSYQNGLEVIGNSVDMLSSTTSSAAPLTVNYSSNVLISKNYFKGRGYGINLNNANANTPVASQRYQVINNMVYAESRNGLRMYGVDKADVWHNSIHGDGFNSSVYVGSRSPFTVSDYDFRNNIFSAVYSHALETNLPDAIFNRLDYNIYNTGSAFNVFNIDGTEYSSLGAYTSVQTQLNSNSIESNPEFVSKTDLHIYGTVANEVGDNSVGITEDIDGKQRPSPGASTVDIGADEFVPPLCPPPVNIAVENIGLDSADIYWTNNGSSMTTFEYVVVLCDDPIGSSTANTTSLDSLKIGSLQANECYDLYVRSICTGNDSSLWIGPLSFNTAKAIPYFEDFESFGIITQGIWPDGWTAASSLYTDWRTNRGTTPIGGGTGPSVDHTLGTSSGIYAYLEVEGGAQGNIADLITPSIVVADTLNIIELSFWYHFYGPTIDRMYVIISTDSGDFTVDTILGQQQTASSDPWLKRSVYLTGYGGQTIKVKFRGVKGIEEEENMAIDDISITTVPKVDAGVVSVANSLNFCSSTISPQVIIKNYGSTPISTANIVYDIAGVILDSVTYTGSLNIGDTAWVSLPSMPITPSDIHNITLYPSMINGLKDENPENDTLTIDGFRLGLSGNYTLDTSLAASANNFTSFKALENTLNTFGVCDPVTINVATGTYNSTLYLKEIPGASALNTITIDGGDSSQTILSSDGTENYATLTFNGAKHVKVQNMTLRMTGSAGNAITFTNGAHHNTLRNSVSWVPNSTSSRIVSLAFSGSAASNEYGSDVDYTLIENNHIIGGYYGIYAMGSRERIISYNRFVGNIIDSARNKGAYLYFHDSLEFVGNSINLLHNTGAANGIEMMSSNNSYISENYIWASGTGYGIFINNTNTYAPIKRYTEISNNMLYSAGSNGLRLQGVDSVNVWHNSINVEGTMSTGHAMYVQNGGNAHDIRNNIFSAKNTLAFYSNSSASIFSKFDFNIFYAPNNSNLLFVDGTNYANLGAFQSAYPQLSLNCYDANPNYISATDLHIDIYSTVVASQAGDNGVGITVDIDGETRPFLGDTAVDIGADEFRTLICGAISPRVDGIKVSSAVLHFNPYFTASDKEYILVGCGFPRSSGTSVTVMGDSVILSNLTPLSCYELYVREICDRGDTTVWAGPIMFNTLSVQYFPIGILNTSNNLGVADSLNVYAWTSGTVVGENLHSGNGYNFTLIDQIGGNQSGINVYSDSIVSSYSVVEGDSLTVRGTVKQNYGLIEFHIDSIEVVSTGNLIPTPRVVSNLDESTESQYLELNKFVLLDSSQIGSYKMRAFNGSDTITINIDAQTDVSDSLAKSNNALHVKDTITILGIGGQYDTSVTPPYLSGYYVTPMRYSDLTIDTASTIVDGAIIGLNEPVESATHCYTSTESVNIELFNNSPVELDFTIDSAAISVAVSGATSQVLTLTINNNTLNNGNPLGSGQSMSVPMGTIDMSNAGSYYFDARVNIAADIDSVNNIYLDTIITLTPSGGIISGMDTICIGDTTTLKADSIYGEIQWQEFDGSVWVDIVGVTAMEYSVSPSVATDYRVISCGNTTSASPTFNVEVINLAAPAALGDTVIVGCGSPGTVEVVLTKSYSSSTFIWYDAAVGGNQITTGGKYYLSVNGDTLKYTDTVNSNASSYKTLWVEEMVPNYDSCGSPRTMVSVGIECLVGLEKATLSNNLTFYPNPTTGSFTIATSGLENDNAIITIRDISGKVIVRENIINSSSAFKKHYTLEGQAKGLYIISIIDGEKQVNKKLILQ